MSDGNSIEHQEIGNGDSGEEKADLEVSLEDVIPLQLSRKDKKTEGETKDENHDKPDAKSEEAPLLPPKIKGGLDIPPSYDVLPSFPVTEDENSGEPKVERIRNAGSLLELLDEKGNKVNSGRTDKEIQIHDLMTQNHKDELQSASVKAFFSLDVSSSTDTVDASDENLSIPSYEYKMDREKRGLFIILNHKTFLPHLRMNDRKGTNEDAFNLERTAKKLGFEHVRTFNDLKFKQIKQVIKQVSHADHSKYDCFALAILTHGDEGEILYANDATFHLDELTEPFMADKCPSLAGKPKLFFIQACRGQKFDHGAEVCDVVDAGITNISNKLKKESLIIPNAADFLLAFSTVPGYYAWRNQSCGSWFIQALCACLREFGSRLELMQIMTRVNRMVAYDFVSFSKSDPHYHGKKQIPSIVTRLTHEVFFRSKSPMTRSQKAESPKPKTLPSRDNGGIKGRVGRVETNV